MDNINEDFSVINKVFDKIDWYVRGLDEVKYIVIRNRTNIRWVIPSDPSYGFQWLKQWRPYGRISRFIWVIFLGLYRLKIVDTFNFFTSIKLKIPNDCSEQSIKDCIPIVYIGTDNDNRKSTILLVNVFSLDCVGVMKIAERQHARKTVKKEVENLYKLDMFGFSNIPKVILYDEKQNISVQTYLIGRPSSHTLGLEHLEFLKKLDINDKQRSFKCLYFELKLKLKQFEIGRYNIDIQSLKDCVAAFDGDDKVKEVIVHGDFVPWNIKINHKNELIVLDWEDGNFCGLPLFDICHFYIMQDFLFGRKLDLSKILNNSFVKEYLEYFNIDIVNANKLIYYYILSRLFEKENVSDEFKKYLLRFIARG